MRVRRPIPTPSHSSAMAESSCRGHHFPCFMTLTSRPLRSIQEKVIPVPRRTPPWNALHAGFVRHRNKHTFLVLSASGSPGETKIMTIQSASNIVWRGISHRRRQSCTSRYPIDQSLPPPYTLKSWLENGEGELAQPILPATRCTEASPSIAGGSER
ncbi:hypothetical protein LZ32DRAFT_229477 [Colletotrichum eremochloae]|nr:hypothetical protein LZ32DRAFT_229477 [Colletotrichum eremochloae]